MSVVPIPSGSVPNKITLPMKKPTVPAALADATRNLLGIIRWLLPEITLADPKSRIDKRRVQCKHTPSPRSKRNR
jgi:hypothetical protein